MDLVARKKLNLEVLKRHDTNICDILDQSAHAVVYKFDTEKTSWEKLGYEGVIFLTQGKSAPYFGLYVLNRLSIENFSLHLTDFEEINLTDEFIIYQTSEGEACALWLFEKKDRERILAKILKLHEGMKALPSAQIVKPVESKVDILQMLKKASDTSPLETVGTDLLKALGGSQSQQKRQPQQPQQQKSKKPQQQQQKQEAQLQPQQQHQQQAQMQPQQQHQAQMQPQQQQQQQQYQQQQYLQQHLQQQQQQQQFQQFSGHQQQNVLTPSMQHSNVNSPFTIPTSDSTERAGNRLQDIFDSSNNIHNKMPDNLSRRVMASGELTKPFYPPFMNMSPAASPRNPGTLLQALHGGIPPPPPTQQNVPMGPPLMPQQVMGLMRTEVARRFAGRPPLSKPEFIQQLLNMIQCDPTFFDILYETYQGQMGHSQSK